MPQPYRWRGYIVKVLAPNARLYEMARELARPVVMDQLPASQANAALWVATLAAERRGELPCPAEDVVRLQRHLLWQEIQRQRAFQDVVGSRIRRVIRPMIAVRKKSNVLLAEAHGVNGEAGFPLSEEQVTDIVRTEVWFALPSQPRMARHGT